MRIPFIRRRTRRRRDNPVRSLFTRARTEPLKPKRGWRFQLQLQGPGMPSWVPSLAVPLRAWKWFVPVMVLGGLYLGVYNLPMFEVRVVNIEGPSGEKVEAVRAAADLMGKNIFSLDQQALHARIEEATGVRVTEVKRRAPDEVTILAVERQPRGIWQIGSERWLVDVEGIVLGPVKPDSKFVTVRQMDAQGPLKPGDRVSADAIYLAEQLEQRTAQAVGANPTAFEWQQDGGMLMRTDKGWNVRLGTSDDLDYKLVVWRAILDRAGLERFAATHADVRFPTRPFVRAR
jgi:cell division septal protein FtsQ